MLPEDWDIITHILVEFFKSLAALVEFFEKMFR